MVKKPANSARALTFFTLFLFIPLITITQETDYHGFRCLNFKFEGYDARIVFPAKAEEERHWIWRALYWGHEPQTEIALLKKGFHVVHVYSPENYGDPDAVRLWNRFYEYLISNYHLNPKAVLEGMSKGGLYIYNWGADNPEKVACIYADAPVCDIRSWPGGKGKGTGTPQAWKEVLMRYNLTEETVNDFKGNPVNNCIKLAAAKVPVLHVCGAVDEVVPIDENTYILENNYRDAGGDIKVIVKEGIGHHPHSLKDPAPIVRFILTHTNPRLLDEPEPVESKMAINFRGNIDNCRIKFEKEKKGRVAFLGGAITWNPGWRDMVGEYLKQKFPSTEFEFINAGIPSLGSTPGAMRISRDILSHGTIDLLFVEAAVNDATNEVKANQQLRGMEGILYQAWRSNPYMDIIMMHFADQDKMADYNNDRIPEVIVQHETAAEYYSVSSINLAKEVNNRIINGEFTWRDDFKNLHPSPFGQKIYFRTINHFFDESWKNPAANEMRPHSLPEKPLDPFSYINGHFLPIGKASKGKGWSISENWKPGKGEQTREGFVNVDVLEATQPGAVLTLNFKGTAIGLFVTAGPDAGILEYSIDGSGFEKADQFTKWSKNLHLPWLIMFADELTPGRHKLVLRVAAEKNPASRGTACRIHEFVVNDQ